LQPQGKYVYCSVLVSIHDQAAYKALMNTNAQFFLNYRPAPRAALAGVAWIDPHCLTASLFRFAHQDKGKLIPRCISNTFGKAMVFEHPINVQVLNRNKPEAVDQLA
jgi:hypothetical protein